MIELVVLPGFCTAVAPNQPIVNGAAMGMTVKTDGADAAAGAILDEPMRANAEVDLGGSGRKAGSDFFYYYQGLDRHVYRCLGVSFSLGLGLQSGASARTVQGRSYGNLAPFP